MNEKAKRMVNTLKEWHCPEHLKDDASIDQFIADVYNEAIKDVEDFIDMMIGSNPQYRGMLMSLKVNMFLGMQINNNTK